MGCLRQIAGLIMVIYGFILSFFVTIGPGGLGHMLLGFALVAVGFVMLFYTKKK